MITMNEDEINRRVDLLMKPKPQEECIYCKEPVREKPWTKTRVLVFGICGTTFVGVCALTIPFISPALRRVCLPYVPATTTQVANVIKALNGRKGTLLDAGSGDGRIVIEASKRGFQSYGVELNYWLVLYSRFRAWREGQSSTAQFMKHDLLQTDMSNYDNIVVFGVDTLMEGLEEKFSKEATRSCRIIVCRFPLPNWHPIKVVGTGIDSVWVYMHPHNAQYKQLKLPRPVLEYKDE